MAKYHYFEELESLANDMAQAVRLCCEDGNKKSGELQKLRRNCDKKICELEKILFSDFLPPLERDNIAACAHCISRVIDRCLEFAATVTTAFPGGIKQNEECEVCISLADTLVKNISLLRNIRKPSEMPSLHSFRDLLEKGRNVHTAMMKKMNSGAIPRSAAQSLFQCTKLRNELSRCFDELVEIMLNNI